MVTGCRGASTPEFCPRRLFSRCERASRGSELELVGGLEPAGSEPPARKCKIAGHG